MTRLDVRYAAIACALTTLASVLLVAQAPADGAKPLAFEVASITRNTSGDIGIGSGGSRFAMGHVRLTNIPLRVLLSQAFRRRSNEIVGGPAWLDTDRWDIVAKADSPTDALMPRVRTLLADRFKLVTHYETRELPIFALVMARPDGKLGPFLRPATDSSGVLIGLNVFKGRAEIGMLVAAVLGAAEQRTVVDRTGLTGIYDIELHWTPDGPPGPDGNDLPQPPSDAPSIFTALQEQLGLRLESTKGPVEVLVIDHVERPAED
jgi:uncharacterized protein (TIGR03435 family)